MPLTIIVEFYSVWNMLHCLIVWNCTHLWGKATEEVPFLFNSVFFFFYRPCPHIVLLFYFVVFVPPPHLSVFLSLQRCVWRLWPAVWILPGRLCCPSCCPPCWPFKLWVGFRALLCPAIRSESSLWEIPHSVKQHTPQGLLVFPLQRLHWAKQQFKWGNSPK